MFKKTYDNMTIEAVWRKGKIIPGYEPSLRRKDYCGATIRRSDHGNRDSVYGWEIDHIDPDGPDILNNYQPLQWENNVTKSDDDDQNYCVVTN